MSGAQLGQEKGKHEADSKIQSISAWMSGLCTVCIGFLQHEYIFSSFLHEYINMTVVTENYIPIKK